MTGSTPPGGEPRIGDHARSHEGKVDAGVSPRFDVRLDEPLQDRSRHSERIVVASGDTCEGVHQHQGANPFRVRRRQHDAGEPAEADPQNCRVSHCLGIQDGKRIPGPLLDGRGIRRAQRVRKPDAPQIESNQP
jgi:hypothetical protein